MRFEGQTNLHNTEAEHNHTNSSYQTENEVGQVIDYGNRVIRRKSGHGCSHNKAQRHYCRAVKTEALPDLARHRQLFGFLTLILLKSFIDKSSF